MIKQSLSLPLISLRDITRHVNTSKDTVRRLLKNVNWELQEGQRVGVIAESMLEAHALLDCAAGITTPQRGHVSIRSHVSWPVGAKGGLSSALSGRQNARFLQGVYGHGGQQRNDLDQIERLADLERGYFDKPLKSYNKYMRARFYLAVSLAFDFDVYVIPQQSAWKSNTNSEKILRLQKALKDRTSGKTILMTNTDFSFLEQFCDDGLVLDQGSIAYSGTFSECRAWYEANINKAPEEDTDFQLDSEETAPTTELESDSLEDNLW